jgi:methanogenic corrinoid protein MtbC1
MKFLFELPTLVADELLAALVTSVDLQTPDIFVDTVAWAQSVLVFRDHSPWALARGLEAMDFQLDEHVSSAEVPTARETLRRGREEVSIVRLIEKSSIDESTQSGAIAGRYLKALLDGDESAASREILLAIAYGQKTLDIYSNILTPALHEVGRLWQRNEITVAHEHLIANATARIMSQALDIAPPRAHRDLSAVTVALGSAEHEVGAQMTADAFALCGWHAAFLGCRVPVNELLAYIEGVSVDVVACSATLARDVPAIRDFIEALETRPVAPLVIVGGAAFDRYPALWREISADGYCPTGLMAVALANELISDSGS